MGIKERRERQKEHLREEILDAARELFLKEGVENVSMRRIAQKIEYSPTTIYLYFKDKWDLFHSICEEAFAKLMLDMEAIKQTESDPIECVRRGAVTYINFGLTHPNHYRVVFLMPHEHLIDGEKAFHFSGSAGEKSFMYLVTQVQRGMEQGKFRKGDPMMVAQTAWAAMHGLTSLLITNPEFPWVERNTLIEHLADTLVRGLQA
jgi:AcrR family transcriptional regulator